jgi:hypothetical protein
MWQSFLEKIEGLNYVVQRNWDYLPERTETHDDIDIFVSLEDKDEMLFFAEHYDFVDVRFPGDGYYPKEIEEKLLTDRREYNGFWIPSKEAHFLALYYHNLVHKQDNPYGDHLESLFLEWCKPTRCVDEGVGYYV